MNTDIAAQKALDKFRRAGVGALSETEKVLLTVWLFEAGVMNSSFESYLAGRRGDLAYNAPAALRAIGAARLAELATEANALFGAGGPHPDSTKRREQVTALPDSARLKLAELDRRFDDCQEDVDELLESYLSRAQSRGS